MTKVRTVPIEYQLFVPAPPPAIRVLHVEDDAEFADLTASFLQQEIDRLEIERVQSADEGLRILKQRNIDCVISDYELPNTDGIEFLRTIRNEHPSLPVVLFTGKGSEEIASEAISAGVGDYLQKGGAERFQILANRIENLVDQFRAETDRDRLATQHQIAAELGQLALRVDSIHALFDQVTEAVASTLETEYAKILQYNREAEYLKLVAGVGWDPDLIESATVDAGENSQAGFTLKSEHPVIVESLENEDRFTGPALLLDHDIVSGISTIIGPLDDPWGILGVHDIEKRQFSTDDVHFLQTVANLLANAIEKFTDQQTFDVIIDTHPGFMYRHSFDDSLSVQNVHGHVETVTGYSDDELLRYSYADVLIHPADREMVLAEMEAAACDAEGYTIEYRIQTKIGTQRWVQDRGKYVPAAIHEPPQLEGLVTDITAQKQHQQELKEMTKQVEAAVAAGNVGTWQWYVQEDKLVVDPAFAQAFGVDPVEARSGVPLARFTDGIHSTDRDRVEQEIQETLETCGSYSIEYRVWNADDQLRWVHARGEVTCDEDGNPTTFPGTLIDITERKHQEQQLNKHKENLEHLQEAANQLYSAGSIEECCQVTISAAVSILGFDWSTLAAPAEDEDYFEIKAVSAGAPLDTGDRPFPIDEGVAGHVYQTKEPNIVYDAGAESRGKPVSSKIKSGLTIPVGDWGIFQAVGTEVNAFDETDLQHAELLISALQTAIDRIQYQEDLHQRNQRLEEFTSVVSHDLRNPLGIAAGRIELAKQSKSDEHLDVAADALERMERLIDNLLSLAKQGEQIGSIEPISIAEMVATCWKSVETGSATLCVDSSHQIRGDRTRVGQLLENLIRNAVDHGGPEVTVTIGDLEGGFFVADSGDGIPDDDRDRIFEAGYSTTTDGTGFGLSIVREIATAHGWQIDVSESESGGARFEFTGVETKSQT